MYWSNCVCVLFQAKAFTTKVEHVSFSRCYFCKRFTVDTLDTLTRAPLQTFLTRPLIFTTNVILLISNNIYHTMLIRKGLAGMEPSKSLKVLSTQNFRG